MQQISSRKLWVDGWNAVLRRLRDADALRELAAESSDASFAGEIGAEIAAVEQGIKDLEFRNMLSGVDDEKNCILTIHSGAGAPSSLFAKNSCK